MFESYCTLLCFTTYCIVFYCCKCPVIPSVSLRPLSFLFCLILSFSPFLLFSVFLQFPNNHFYSSQQSDHSHESSFSFNFDGDGFHFIFDEWSKFQPSSMLGWFSYFIVTILLILATIVSIFFFLFMTVHEVFPNISIFLIVFFIFLFLFSPISCFERKNKEPIKSKNIVHENITKNSDDHENNDNYNNSYSTQ